MLKRAEIIAPDGASMLLEADLAGSKVGYILDRKVFDREVVWQAAEAGADVMVKTRASAPLMAHGAVNGAVLDSCGEKKKVHADITIAADGVESKFSRWCGVDTTGPVREMTSVSVPDDRYRYRRGMTTFFLGNEVAPEGYLWIFPKGKRTANVGIGISGKKSGAGHRAKDYLDRFTKKRFPDGKTIECIVGGVSVCRPLACTVADGLIIVGDAARVADPLTGGGIYNAMFTGDLAVQVASNAIGNGKLDAAALMPYDEQWRASLMGKAIERNYHIKEYLVKLSDEKSERDHPFGKVPRYEGLLNPYPCQGTDEAEPETYRGACRAGASLMYFIGSIPVCPDLFFQ